MASKGIRNRADHANREPGGAKLLLTKSRGFREIRRGGHTGKSKIEKPRITRPERFFM